MNARITAPPLERSTRVVAVTGGKGGVGKTTVSINLAAALAAQGEAVVLLDADLGLANVDVLLGLSPTRTLAEVVAGECALEDVILSGPYGMGIVPGASGIQHMAALDVRARSGIIAAFGALERRLDCLVVDTAAGIGGTTLDFCSAAHDVLVVVCDDPASIMDAYATIKVLAQGGGKRRFRVLVNMSATRRPACGSTPACSKSAIATWTSCSTSRARCPRPAHSRRAQAASMRRGERGGQSGRARIHETRA